ncbi:MAG: phosphotransferase [Clostridioides sp.]|jgi:aminoglycoside phosphotransferase (APT) family kinase protein|nr:phosphotransferase [Clostridioides sp.]
MSNISALYEYVNSKKFKQALKINEEHEISIEMLAQGEYNINYKFYHPDLKKMLVLRVNTHSQMNLENQIEYEYNALKLIESSGRTPKVFYVDGSKKDIEFGILVMEYLEGRHLDYKTDMKLAAECLADIHSIKTIKNELIYYEKPLKAILTECEQMFKIYFESELAEDKKKFQIRRMLDKIWLKINKLDNINCESKVANKKYKCCINTELNSTNFLINSEGKKNYLIDWEKPLFGEVAQDLGHFLAPTTTFWKTDVILSQSEIDDFISTYIKSVNGRFETDTLREDVDLFIPVTCLRGITWCAMAWIEYRDPNKLIFNQSTFDKLNQYLSDEFLNDIEKRISK